MTTFARVLAAAALAAAGTAHAESFDSIWSQVQDGQYAVGTAPVHATTYNSFWDGSVDLLKNAAWRTLNTDADILPPFQKLVHPIGICFAGTWTITEANAYSGYFARGSQGLIIVRASEALGTSDAGDYRSFGFAGKIFPTLDGSAELTTKTANFFTVDDLGGTMSESFLDLPKKNEPATSFHFSQLAIFPMLTKIASTFKAADQNPGIRQVYQISQLGIANPALARTPHWFQVVSENNERNGSYDFRDELRLEQFPGGLRWGIYVAEDDDGGWHRIGQIKLDREAYSYGCDHRLHFPHPKFQ
jgi:hypothetical protein